MLNGIYEIVIYTAELGMTVFPLLEAVDPNNLITYKLVRDATNFVDGHHVKDLDKLNRSLTKVILHNIFAQETKCLFQVIAVDWDDDNIQYNKENVLRIKRWNGDDHDTTLIDLANFLRGKSLKLFFFALIVARVTTNVICLVANVLSSSHSNIVCEQ